MTTSNDGLCICGCEQVLTGRRKKYASSECSKRNGRAAHIMRRYGITMDQWQAIWDEQEGLCAVCKKPEKDDKNFVIDHEHQTGIIRGLLHSWCNLRVVGRHSSAVLVAVGRYAEDPPAVRALGEVIAPKRKTKKRPVKRSKRRRG